MYNRYIPQPDGSYRRSTVPEPAREARRHAAPQNDERSFEEDHSPEPEKEEKEDIRREEKPRQRRASGSPPRPSRPRRPSSDDHPPKQDSRSDSSGSVLQFLRQLLPKDFDTGDLIVVLLLLLMSADCAEDQNTALLTLALYLFM